MEKVSKLKELVEDWAVKRGIFKESNSQKQLSKTEEELNELIEDLTSLPRIFEKITDDIGDTFVTLILYSKMKNLDFMSIYNSTYKAHKEANKGFISPRVIVREVKNIFSQLKASEDASESSDIIKTHLENLFSILYSGCNHINKTPAHCIEYAYNVIKNRKGKMVNGLFVKE